MHTDPCPPINSKARVRSQPADTWTPGCSVPAPAWHVAPALDALLERAIVVAAGVVVQVHDARVALLSLVHPGIPTHFVAALLETLLGLTFNGLIDGLFTAVRKHLKRKKATKDPK